MYMYKKRARCSLVVLDENPEAARLPHCINDAQPLQRSRTEGSSSCFALKEKLAVQNIVDGRVISPLGNSYWKEQLPILCLTQNACCRFCKRTKGKHSKSIH